MTGLNWQQKYIFIVYLFQSLSKCGLKECAGYWHVAWYQAVDLKPQIWTQIAKMKTSDSESAVRLDFHQTEETLPWYRPLNLPTAPNCHETIDVAILKKYLGKVCWSKQCSVSVECVHNQGIKCNHGIMCIHAQRNMSHGVREEDYCIFRTISRSGV